MIALIALPSTDRVQRENFKAKIIYKFMVV